MTAKIIKDVLSSGECDSLVWSCLPNLTRAMIGPPGNRKLHNSRIAWNYKCPSIPETVKIQEKILELAGVEDFKRVETVEFVMYPEGGFYKPHVDGSNRSHTMIVNLSDCGKDHEGGGTTIHEGSSVETLRPTKGQAIFWEGQKRHEAGPVTRGVRFVAVAWIKKS